MKNEEIAKGNIVIAKFMEYVWSKEGDGKTYLKNCPDQKDIYSVKPYQLRFHVYWDSLMPVIDKIESLNIRDNGHDFPKVKFMGDCCEIFAYANFRGTSFYWKPYMTLSGYDRNHVNQCESKILAAWKAVVEFIEWYNKQK